MAFKVKSSFEPGHPEYVQTMVDVSLASCMSEEKIGGVNGGRRVEACRTLDEIDAHFNRESSTIEGGYKLAKIN